MDIKLYQSASEIDCEQWKALRPKARGAQPWFLTSEAYFRSMNHVYVTAWDNGQLRAILPLYDKYDPAYFNVTQCFEPVTQRLLARQRFLCVGSRLGFEAGAIGDERYEGALIREAAEVARSMGVDYLAANLTRSPLPGWEEHRIRFVYNAYVINLRGDSYSDYMDALKHDKRRIIKKELGTAVPVFKTTLLGNEKRFNALRTISCNRQGGTNYLGDGFFKHLARTHGDSLLVIASGTEEEWTGANVLLTTENELCCQAIGVHERNLTYFNLMFHEPMRIAYERGWRQIDLGAGCDEAKRRRGADPVPLTAYLKPISRKCVVSMSGVEPVANITARIARRLRRMIHSGQGQTSQVRQANT